MTTSLKQTSCLYVINGTIEQRRVFQTNVHWCYALGLEKLTMNETFRHGPQLGSGCRKSRRLCPTLLTPTQIIQSFVRCAHSGASTFTTIKNPIFVDSLLKVGLKLIHRSQGIHLIILSIWYIFLTELNLVQCQPLALTNFLRSLYT